MLSNLSGDRAEVLGVWTHWKAMTFRMRTYDSAARFPIGTEFTDFPASVFRYAALLPGYRKTGPSSETLAALSRISSGSG